MSSIKNMKLYSSLDRVERDLAAAGHPSGPVPVDVLARFDQLHYHGTDAVDHAIQAVEITAESRVLDIGSGYGGPARWVAHQTGARVDAIELQPDLNDFAKSLTARAGLSEKVSHIQGDILETPLMPEIYTAAISFLALYHIPARESLFPNVKNALKSGGYLYVEDLYRIGTPTQSEQDDLDGMMQANTLPTREIYIAELSTAGFSSICFKDMTENWAEFTAGRLADFRLNRPAYEQIHGSEVFDALEHFYLVISGLLAGGNLGGVRYTARKL
ncbi:MAG: cyclopropane-fatty-acyl-phospholipid synthase family protein [Paracoccaceae bacterium]